jgi:hypothetical protein
LISSDFHWDHERFFWVNHQYNNTIHQVRDRSIFIPYSLRPWLFNRDIYFIDIFGTAFNWFWFDKVTPVIGLLAIFPLIFGILKSGIWDLTSIFLVVLAGSLSRNPNGSAIYLLVLPQLIYLITLSLHEN